MKISTSRFKEAVNTAVKGAGFNKLIPLTSMIGIKVGDGNLILSCTDMSNSISYIIDKIADEDMDITVDADKFSKLINKMTSDTIELDVQDDVLTVKGNGVYKLPLIADEDGLISFPHIEVIDDAENEVLLSSILNIYNVNRYALASTLEQPELVGYYCGTDKVISTDASVITINSINAFNSTEPMLISAQLMQLLALNKQEKIKWSCSETSNELVFVTDNMIVSGPILEGIENYPVDAIVAYLDEAFTSSCKLPKELLLNVCDRLSLFIEPYDKNGAYFTFGRTGLTIHSRKEASTEIISYVESKDFKAFTCCVDIPLFKEQVQANPDDTIKMFYGNDNALKMESGNIIQIVALLEDELTD